MLRNGITIFGATRFTLLILATVVATGCGRRDQVDTKAQATTQVAAKVNSEEITVHQINFVLARNPNIKPEAAHEAKREILKRLIDQELAKQEAIANMLDRSPGIVQAVEAARTEILARAHLEKIAAAQPRPTEDEVRKYYQEHPELFARRRVFNIEEILIAPQEGLPAALREQVAKLRSMKDILAWLKLRDAKFSANRGVRAAEQIPLEQLPKLQDMKDGTTQVFEASDGRLQVLRIVNSKLVPVDEISVAPRIRQFLVNRRSNEAVAAELKRLRDKSQIAYAGEFASEAAAAEAKAKAEADLKAKALATSKAREQAEAQARAEERSRTRRAAEAQAQQDAEARAREAPSKPVQLPQENIEKGLRGLK